MIVRYRRLALADIEDIENYLRERSPAGARNVLQAIADAIGAISEHPFAAIATSKPGIRVKTVNRYRYRIFYRVTDDAVEIVHVRHTSRRPWA